MMLPLLISLLFLVGGAGGFLSGLLGVGGGIVFVPVLFFSLPALGVADEYLMQVAVASSLALVIVTTFTSAHGHYRRGAVDMGVLKSWGPFLVVGVVAGALVGGIVGGSLLKIVFACVTLGVAVYMARGGADTPDVPVLPLHENLRRGLCAMIGAAAAMTGMGGAVMSVPLMRYTGVPMQKAIGTGAALGVMAAVPGMLGYIVTGLAHRDVLPPASLGFVNVMAVAVMIPAALLLTPIGVRVSHVTNKILLRRIFAVVLAAVSVRMFLSL